MKNDYLSIFFFFTFAFSSLLTISHSKIIRTSLGEVNGAHIGNAHLFKRIPFSKPPIGKLRFQKPEPAVKWSGVLDTTKYGPACMSNSSQTQSPQKWVDEDCLHINIFTSDHCLSTKNCAVIYYIHGGGLNYDSAVMFNDSILLDTFVSRDVILVLPAFRLGIFSHFMVEDQSIAPNNLALYDILLSLEFVKREIKNFGGDNKKVTLFGHSYGGSVTGMLSFSPRINKDLSLFQQSVSMSTGHEFDSLEHQINRTRNFAKYANCLFPVGNHNHNILTPVITQNQQDRYMMECLQKKDAMELLRIQRHLEDLGFDGQNSVVMREPLFAEVPYSEFMSTPKNIPMITGCTRYEMDHSPEYKPVGESLGFQNPKEVEEKYFKDREEGNFDFKNHSDETLAIFVQTRLRANSLLNNGIPVYLYEYTYPLHAKHTDDLSYLMGVHRFEMDENERQLSEVYKSMFINFAKFGEPRVDGFEAAQLENSTYFEVYWNETSGRRPEMKYGFEEEMLDYWMKDMMEYDRNITILKSKTLPKLSISPRFYPSSYNFTTDAKVFSIILVLLIFLTGCMVGRCSSNKKNLYIRLDGTDSQFKEVRGI